MKRTICLFHRFALACICVILLSGCAEYAKKIYFLQHLVSTALGQASFDAEDRGDFMLADELYDAEDRVVEACELLQERARQHLNTADAETAEEVGKIAVYNSLNDCATVSRETEELLWEKSPDIARDYFGEQPQ